MYELNFSKPVWITIATTSLIFAMAHGFVLRALGLLPEAWQNSTNNPIFGLLMGLGVYAMTAAMGNTEQSNRDLQGEANGPSLRVVKTAFFLALAFGSLLTFFLAYQTGSLQWYKGPDYALFNPAMIAVMFGLAIIFPTPWQRMFRPEGDERMRQNHERAQALTFRLMFVAAMGAIVIVTYSTWTTHLAVFLSGGLTLTAATYFGVLWSLEAREPE